MTDQRCEQLPDRRFTRTRARLQRPLDELLDGTGTIRPALQPLADDLLAMPKPDRALNWLRNNPQLPGYLQPWPAARSR
jgi:hypothetical protein